MNILLSFLQLLTIIGICIFEYKKKSISIFMWATLLLMFGVPHFLAVLLKNSVYNEQVMMKSSLFVILFNFVYIISKIVIVKSVKHNRLRNEEKFRSVNNLSNDKFNKVLYYNFFILLTISFFILLISIVKNLGGIIEASWGEIYLLNRELGLKSSIRYGNFLFFASAGVALVFYRYKKKVFLFLSLVLIVLYALLTGNRITILPLLVAIISIFIFYSKKKLSIRKLVLLGLFGFLTIYIVYFLRLLRIYGGLYNFVNNFEFFKMNSLLLNMMLNGDGELSLRNAFYYFIEINNSFPGFNEGHTYLRLLLIAIPTTLSLGLKPPDFAITMGSAYIGDINNTTYSMHPTFYGDVFANFGWFGIYFGLFWAILSVLINILINRNNIVIKNILIVLFGVVFVIVGRGSVYNGFFIGYAGSIIMGAFYLFTRVSLNLIKKNN